jgi:hypothetical protein
VSSAGGAGCASVSEGRLYPGHPKVAGEDPAGDTIGALCGSSDGQGTRTFTAADNSLYTEAVLWWDQSAATILPLSGYITKAIDGGITHNYPEGARPTLVGFTSSRGLSGGGTCGITDPTLEFQVEGMIVAF